ncbi:uncharacterized protein LOC116849279 [Odontomachus brunneus]|uniref:uncharacterized protein LOC116849279 n=1 Tax=Odontomachus brunneus TaxID=486640 RepID=UPI0013F297F4|nr:uncharacterized protein LOC116849279 [Odontomachus brunneus]
MPSCHIGQRLVNRPRGNPSDSFSTNRPISLVLSAATKHIMRVLASHETDTFPDRARLLSPWKFTLTKSRNLDGALTPRPIPSVKCVREIRIACNLNGEANRWDYALLVALMRDPSCLVNRCNDREPAQASEFFSPWNTKNEKNVRVPIRPSLRCAQLQIHDLFGAD